MISEHDGTEGMILKAPKEKKIILCAYCKEMWMDDRSPEMCESKEAKKKFGGINYCEEYNKNKNCEFYKPNFGGTLRDLIK
jgi:hypothetical protein